MPKLPPVDDHVSSDKSEEILKKAQDQWNHEDFRKRVLVLVTEHVGTRAFEESIDGIIARYIKIKTSERVFWIIGAIVIAGITFLIGKYL
jgi:hypothetical protein